ncbi:MAG: ABC transporter permease [Deltaproteobacteria bacterium]|nr:ABC transporter permease [Deltaproteobacteria bacterium]
MKAFFNHLSFDFRTGIRNKNLLLMNYLLPLGFYLMMGLVMAGLNPYFLPVMIPAMVIFAILSGTLLGLPDPLVKAREDGIFRSFKINGVPAFSILVIPAMTTLLHLIITAMIISVTAPLFFKAPLPTDWLNFILISLLTAFTCSGLGVLIGVISASSRITVIWSQMIYLPSMLLGGMMVPYDLLPDTPAKISRLLPATHAMNAFRGMAFGLEADFNAVLSVVILLTSGLLAFGLATYLFNWDSLNRSRRGRPLLSAIVTLPYIAGLLWLR